MGAGPTPTPFDRRAVRRSLLVVVVAVLVLPVARNVDGFPLSTYPMYSSARPAEVFFVTAHGVDRAGEVVRLDIDTIGATDDPLIASGELRAAIRAGQAPARCREIAARVDADDAVRVEIVTERHDVIAHTLDRPSVLDRVVHASCLAGASA